MATSGLPAKPIGPWKRLAIVSFFGGVGLAFAAVVILGSFLWYKSRPTPTKPWNTKAITASYDMVDSGAKENHIVFYYVLENTTDEDYRVENASGVSLTSKLAQQGSLSPFKTDNETIQYPIFIPAKQRLRFSIEIPYPYNKTLRSDAPLEERRKFRRELEQYVGTELANLNGFVIFDTNKRYEIDFPNGWSWQPSWTTAPDKSKTAKSKLVPAIAFTDDWLHFTPLIGDDQQNKLVEKGIQNKAAFVAAFQHSPSCSTVTLEQTNPERADFHFQLFNGLDGRTGEWQWVLNRTDNGERLAFGEEADVSTTAGRVCSAVLSNVKKSAEKTNR